MPSVKASSALQTLPATQYADDAVEKILKVSTLRLSHCSLNALRGPFAVLNGGMDGGEGHPAVRVMFEPPGRYKYTRGPRTRTRSALSPLRASLRSSLPRLITAINLGAHMDCLACRPSRT
jgi:hypothetical protein